MIFFFTTGDTTRFTVGNETGIVRLVGPPQVNWDFETQANSYMITVRATDFPNGSPRLTVSFFSMIKSDSLNSTFLMVLF